MQFCSSLPVSFSSTLLTYQNVPQCVSLLSLATSTYHFRTLFRVSKGRDITFIIPYLFFLSLDTHTILDLLQVIPCSFIFSNFELALSLSYVIRCKQRVGMSQCYSSLPLSFSLHLPPQSVSHSLLSSATPNFHRRFRMPLSKHRSGYHHSLLLPLSFFLLIIPYTTYEDLPQAVSFFPNIFRNFDACSARNFK